VRDSRLGFTLIELSIVLVIVGLIAGGVMVGRDLIEAAAIRAQVTQIEKYETAVNTFRSKYNYFPGDIPAAQAAQVGLISRGGGLGDGDGNDAIESLGSNGPALTLGGETVFFWTDLSSAQLIDGSFAETSDNVIGCVPCTTIGKWLPAAKTGHNGYFYAGSGFGYGEVAFDSAHGLQFVISSPVSMDAFAIQVVPALTVAEAYSIDNKIDDGNPVLGNVVVSGPGQRATQQIGTPIYLGGSTDRYCLPNVGGSFSMALAASWTYNLKFPQSLSCNLTINTHM
jgi:prepilin-type N-terminal cleavage/methylation domain-containing protein